MEGKYCEQFIGQEGNRPIKKVKCKPLPGACVHIDIRSFA